MGEGVDSVEEKGVGEGVWIRDVRTVVVGISGYRALPSASFSALAAVSSNPLARRRGRRREVHGGRRGHRCRRRSRHGRWCRRSRWGRRRASSSCAPSSGARLSVAPTSESFALCVMIIGSQTLVLLLPGEQQHSRCEPDGDKESLPVPHLMNWGMSSLLGVGWDWRWRSVESRIG